MDHPAQASKFYTNSLNEKANLRRDLESWRGKSFTDEELDKFDLESIVGRPCLLSIVAGRNGKTVISGVSGLPKGTKCRPQVNPAFTFWLDEFDPVKFDQVSDGIKRIIERSEEWASIAKGNGTPVASVAEEEEYSDDDIPF